MLTEADRKVNVAAQGLTNKQWIGLLLDRINKADDDQLPHVIEHFKNTLIPKALDWLIDDLIDALARKGSAKLKRVKEALLLIGAAAVMPMAIRLASTKSQKLKHKLVEQLNEMGPTCHAAMLPLLRTSVVGSTEELRQAARRGLQGMGIPFEGKAASVFAQDERAREEMVVRPVP